MELRLKVLVGGNAGQELLVPGPKFFIGRAEDCQLRPRSDLISRHHCALMVEDDFVAVRDFGSKNGTLVNDVRVTGEQELRSGDRLKVGPLEFEVLVGSTVTSKKRPKVETIKEAAERTAESSGDSSSLDMDVSQWIAPSDKHAGQSDTRVIVSNETSEIDLSAETVSQGLPLAVAAVATSNPAPAPAAVAPPAESKTPGKLPPHAKAKAVDSRNAAADVLNKFFKRR